jgi:hypothetical protein
VSVKYEEAAARAELVEKVYEAIFPLRDYTTEQAEAAVEVFLRNPTTREVRIAEKKLTAIKVLADSWAVDDDTYLHMESCQDLGYADAAVQLLTILAGVEGNQT